MDRQETTAIVASGEGQSQPMRAEKTIKSYIGPYTDPYRPDTGRLRILTDPILAVYGPLPTRYWPYMDPYRPDTGRIRTLTDPIRAIYGPLPTRYGPYTDPYRPDMGLLRVLTDPIRGGSGNRPAH